MKLVYLQRFNTSKKYEEAGQYLWDHYITALDNVIAGSLTLECLYLPLKNIVWDALNLKFQLKDIEQNELIANDIDVFEINRKDSLVWLLQEGEKCLDKSQNSLYMSINSTTDVYNEMCSPSSRICDKSFNHPDGIHLFQSATFDESFTQYRMCGILNRMPISVICDIDKYPIDHKTKSIKVSKDELSQSKSKISVQRFESDGKMTMKQLIDKSFDFEFLKNIATSTTFQVKDIMSVVCKKSDYNIKNQYIFDILKRIYYLDNIGKVKYRNTNTLYPIITGGLYNDDDNITLCCDISNLRPMMMDFLVDRLDKRHEKYTKRGFDCGIKQEILKDIGRKLDELTLEYANTISDQIKKKHKHNTDDK
jgi:hypothetical protein